MASTDSQLYDETFTIQSIDSLKYDRVSRLQCFSADGATTMYLDINHELFPCVPNESLQVVVATTLSLDGTKDDGKGWRDTTGETSLADMFDYVCHGKVYKFEDRDDGMTMNVFASFGGLLLSLSGPYKKLTPLRQDYIYLLIKK